MFLFIYQIFFFFRLLFQLSNEGDEFSPDEKFVDRFNQLRKINKFTDCSFKVENRVLSCHKLILCAASPVFEAMLYSKFSEGADYSLDASNSIKITDISSETFELFLDYIYTGELRLNNDGNEMNRLMDLAYCAQKYLIEDMRKQCVKKLTEFLDHNSIFMILGKSFEMHLEDFLVSCLYFIADSLEAGSSFSNLVLNNEESHLTPRCFEFLVKNLLDYLGDRDDILCLIKAWVIMECQIENSHFDDESQTLAVSKLNFDETLSEKIVQLRASFAEPSAVRIPRNFHRVYYKPVRPLIIDRNQMSFSTQLSFKRFAIINILMINSRFIPEQYDICDMNNRTYTENLHVEIIDKASSKSIYNQNHTIDNVNFNSFFQIKFNDSMVCFPNHVYIVKLNWSIEAISFEYPRCVFSLLEKDSDRKVDDKKNPLSIVQFHEYDYCLNPPLGSVVQGISYDLVL